MSAKHRSIRDGNQVARVKDLQVVLDTAAFMIAGLEERIAALESQKTVVILEPSLEGVKSPETRESIESSLENTHEHSDTFAPVLI